MFITKNFKRLFYAVRSTYPVWSWINRKEKFVGTDLRSEELKRRGILITEFNKVVPGVDWKALIPKGEGETLKGKPFLKRYVGSRIKRDPLIDSLVENKNILGIVGGYLGFVPQFAYYDLNKTIVNKGEDLKMSQKWHRDPDDKVMCKVFVYLSDVDEESGPFCYIPESQYGGKYAKVYPQRPPKGVYPPEGEIERLIPEEAVLKCTGKAGSLIFADTAGLHYGGMATGKERLMLTISYTTKASIFAKKLSKEFMH